MINKGGIFFRGGDDKRGVDGYIKGVANNICAARAYYQHILFLVSILP